jgi:hypothetical protein
MANLARDPRLTALACVLSACATSHVVVTHIGPGRGKVVSKTCDTTGPAGCGPDGLISCEPPATPTPPSDTPAAVVERPGCFADVDRQHRLDPAALDNDVFTSFGGSDTHCGNVPNYCVVEQQLAGEVFVSFAHPPVPQGPVFDLTVEVSGNGTVTNDTETSPQCGLACRGYTAGRIVTLIAHPPPNFTPGGVVTWRGCYVVRENNGTSRCIVLMDATKTVRAKFNPPAPGGGSGGTGTGGAPLCGGCTKDADCAPSPTGNPGGTVCHNGKCEEECNKPRVPLCFLDSNCMCMQDSGGNRHACPADPIGGGTSVPDASVGLCGACRADRECGSGACHNGRCEEHCGPPCAVDSGCRCATPQGGHCAL